MSTGIGIPVAEYDLEIDTFGWTVSYAELESNKCLRIPKGQSKRGTTQ